MSNVVAREETAGRCLTYLPKYVLSTDPLLQRPDEELRALFFNGLTLDVSGFKDRRRSRESILTAPSKFSRSRF